MVRRVYCPPHTDVSRQDFIKCMAPTFMGDFHLAGVFEHRVRVPRIADAHLQAAICARRGLTASATC